ncbi:CAP domain-containing protein [Yinghuangia soli]|uniref:CAP domain-containing protein n=1 Tax=Yinghuangia soli TaxID=2908204 RepID=A0AA41PZ75_9ACTN|nr:CAP domain-containing protein [Yinghuangia soli]MCF2528371.1 CAP domain-containing protein [Yinghuangia soli]
MEYDDETAWSEAAPEPARAPGRHRAKGGRRRASGGRRRKPARGRKFAVAAAVAVVGVAGAVGVGALTGGDGGKGGSVAGDGTDRVPHASSTTYDPSAQLQGGPPGASRIPAPTTGSGGPGTETSAAPASPAPATTAAPATTPPTSAPPASKAPSSAPPASPTPAKTTARPSSPVPTTAAAYAEEVVRIANAERAKAGCGPLADDPKLRAAAQAHSEDMANRDYFSHTSPEGTSAGDRITKAGYSWSTWGENIAAGQRTPAAVMEAWMNSPGHRANILNCNFKDLGVGVDMRSGGPTWTQNFAAKR